MRERSCEKMPMLQFEPQVARAQEDPRAFWACEACRRVTKAAVFFNPGLLVCEECFVRAVRAYLADAGTAEALAGAVAQTAEKVCAAAVRQLGRDLGQALAPAVLKAALGALSPARAGETGEQEQ